MIFLHLAILLALSYVMGIASSLIAKNVRKLAEYWRTNDFVVAFLIVGVATSTPEITVAINSALKGVPELSLGNLLGASIVLLSLMTGLAAILAGKLTIRHILNNQTFFLGLALFALPALAIADGRISRFDGIWLIVAYILYIWFFYKHQKILRPPSQPSLDLSPFNLRKAILWLLLGLAGIIVAAYYVVNSALFVAGALHISPVLIGLLILSIGTNLPELALILTQTRGGSKSLVLGDTLSNIALNVPTLGLLALISPFTITVSGSIALSATALIVAIALFGFFMWSKKALTRTEGILMLTAYAGYALFSAWQHLITT